MHPQSWVHRWIGFIFKFLLLFILLFNRFPCFTIFASIVRSISFLNAVPWFLVRLMTFRVWLFFLTCKLKLTLSKAFYHFYLFKKSLECLILHDRLYLNFGFSFVNFMYRWNLIIFFYNLDLLIFFLRLLFIILQFHDNIWT